MQEVDAIERFLNDPWLIKARENATVQVEVPKVPVSPAALPPRPQFGGEEAAVPAASAQVKRVKQGAAASINGERFGSGDLVVRLAIEIAIGSWGFNDFVVLILYLVLLSLWFWSFEVLMIYKGCC